MIHRQYNHFTFNFFSNNIFSITMEEAKDVHSTLRKAAGIFHYVKVPMAIRDIDVVTSF